MFRLRDSKSAGFTLIELMVVIAIIAILSLVVIANLSSARTKANDSQVTQNVDQVSKAAVLAVNNDDVYDSGGESTTLHSTMSSRPYSIISDILE